MTAISKELQDKAEKASGVKPLPPDLQAKVDAHQASKPAAREGSSVFVPLGEGSEVGYVEDRMAGRAKVAEKVKEAPRVEPQGMQAGAVIKDSPKEMTDDEKRELAYLEEQVKKDEAEAKAKKAVETSKK